jgi:hypothetical protein
MVNVLICQSCGMPLNKEENKGTNKDKTKNDEYCKFCFLEGKFTNPQLTMEDQINKGIEMSKKMWMPEDKAKEIAWNTIPKLKRWIK